MTLGCPDGLITEVFKQDQGSSAGLEFRVAAQQIVNILPEPARDPMAATTTAWAGFQELIRRFNEKAGGHFTPWDAASYILIEPGTNMAGQRHASSHA